MCGTTLSKAEQRAVSRVSVTRWCACHICTARFGFRSSVHVASFLRIRLRASVPAFPARSGRRSSEFGLRFAAGLAMGRGRRRVVGRRNSRSVRGGMLVGHRPIRAAARPHVMGRGGHVDTLLALYATRRSHEFSPVFTSRHLVNATQRPTGTHCHTLYRQHRTERLNPEAA
jgi:hypothetical protein